jgi:sugar lactone lactonase YvrE
MTLLRALKHPIARRRFGPATLAAGVASTLLVTLAPGVAHAAVTEATVNLPTTTVADVVTTGSRVFVSGGVTSGVVVVTNPAGGNQQIIGDLPGPTDLELSPDRRTLFVALHNSNEIAAFDTTTLQETARFATGLGECPSSLASSGTTLWFGYGCDQWGGNIGRIDLAASPPAVSVLQAPVDFYDHPMLSAPRDNPNLLFAGQPGLSPGSVRVLAVDADHRLTVAGSTDTMTIGSNLNDLAPTADGSAFYTASGAPYEILRVRTSQLQVAERRFVIQPYPVAVELSADGTQVAAGADGGGLFVFRPTSATATRLPLSGDQSFAEGGLAWGPAGNRLYAITSKKYVSQPPPAILHIYTASIVAATIAA